MSRYLFCSQRSIKKITSTLSYINTWSNAIDKKNDSCKKSVCLVEKFIFNLLHQRNLPLYRNKRLSFIYFTFVAQGLILHLSFQNKMYLYCLFRSENSFKHSFEQNYYYYNYHHLCYGITIVLWLSGRCVIEDYLIFEGLKLC